MITFTDNKKKNKNKKILNFVTIFHDFYQHFMNIFGMPKRMEGKRESYPWTPENVIFFLAEENCRYLHFFFFFHLYGRKTE